MAIFGTLAWGLPRILRPILEISQSISTTVLLLKELQQGVDSQIASLKETLSIESRLSQQRELLVSRLEKALSANGTEHPRDST